MHKVLQPRQTTLGWDVGGAHLKAVLVDEAGTALQAVQVACPLWKGIDQLSAAMHQVLDQLDQYPQQHAVTMTGELADIFPDRKTGVVQIADVASEQLVGRLAFYAGAERFEALADVGFNADAIASANWLASAAFVSRHVADGIMLDIGSTTSDIIPLVGGRAVPRGMNDGDRMRFQELIYAGVVRTPLMAIAHALPFGGEWTSVAAEHFSTAADVYRLTGELPAEADMADAADGAGKSHEESARRLARMIGRDLGEAPPAAWLQLAYSFRHLQLQRLGEAILRQTSFHSPSITAAFVGAGVGSFLVEDLARRFHSQYVDVRSLITAKDESTRQWAAICLPAYAVGWLAVQP